MSISLIRLKCFFVSGYLRLSIDLLWCLRPLFLEIFWDDTIFVSYCLEVLRLMALLFYFAIQDYFLIHLLSSLSNLFDFLSYWYQAFNYCRNYQFWRHQTSITLISLVNLAFALSLAVLLLNLPYLLPYSVTF